MIGAGLAATLVLVGVVSTLPVVGPATVSAGSAGGRPARAAIVPNDEIYDVLPDGAAAATLDPAGFVDTNLINAPRASHSTNNADALITRYTVVSGDTVVDIAAKFGISSETLYWANKSQLADPYSIMPGQVLLIPPVNGLVIKIAADDTLESLAAEYKVTTQAIVEANNLTDPILIAGDSLIIPGAKGAGGIPTPQPTATPRKTTTRTTTTSAGGSAPAVTYTGGRFVWPVFGGYISQYYHYGHPALDIAAPYGTGVRAAAPGKVVYAGWRSYSGGGNVIWISHGGVYTTYNHLSAWSVGVGQWVAAGQRIGAVGMSGVSTGPHLHFEVWTVYPWSYGTTYGTQNPCRYLGC